VLSFQTPAGGWSKNLDMNQHRRAPGERFSQHDAASRYLAPFDNDFPRDKHWNYVGTFDNGATITQLRYLAKVIAALGAGPDAAYRTAFLRGMDYIFAAQFPNGGWPQVWPLQGGYHDAVTFNDDAMIHVLELLSSVARGEKEFAFVSKQLRDRAKASLKRGIECILEAQIIVIDHCTVWCQQHDALTLRPTSARNYEMPSQCGAESARITLFLMGLPEPDPRIISAVHSAIVWFEKVALHDVAFKAIGSEGRKLVSSPGASPLWARYYEIGSDRPIFGDRDMTIHDDINEISGERRNGYSWFNEGPKLALEQYAEWNKKNK
jgi:PelA/Pel-15E family pectate lyase